MCKWTVKSNPLQHFRTVSLSFQTFQLHGCSGCGGRVFGVGGAGGATCSAGLTTSYADSVRSRAAFDVIGRPLRPNHHQQHRHLRIEPHHHQQQQNEGTGMADNLRSGDDITSTINRLRSLQAELQSRDYVGHGLTNSNEQQPIVRKDKVLCDSPFYRSSIFSAQRYCKRRYVLRYFCLSVSHSQRMAKLLNI